MPHTATKLPQTTWGDLEAIFDSLAETGQQKNSVHHLLQVTREMSPYLTRLDLLREIICIALVLLPAEAQPNPQGWRWLSQGLRIPWRRLLSAMLFTLVAGSLLIGGLAIAVQLGHLMQTLDVWLSHG